VSGVSGRNWRAAIVVDDDRWLRALVSQLLHELGLPTVLEAASASEGIELLRNVHPDLVITDWAMETSDAGLEVVRAAHRLGSSVLVVSGAEPTLPPGHASVRWVSKTELSLARLKAELDALST
jgi:CheY-like chemotaxis protein